MFWMHTRKSIGYGPFGRTLTPGQAPILSSPDAVLDPWPEQVTDVLTTQVGTYPSSPRDAAGAQQFLGESERELFPLQIVSKRIDAGISRTGRTCA